MSSAINVPAILATISVMELQLSQLRAQLGASGGKAPAPAPAAKAEKKPRKKSDAPPTAWRLFTDRVRDLLRSVKDAEGKDVYSGKAIGVQCVQFCATLKDENSELSSWVDADILARRADWSAPEVSRGEAKLGKGWAKTGERKAAAKAASVASSAASVTDGEGDAEVSVAASTEKPKKERKNPWVGLSPEAKAAKVAAMKEGRAAKKAAAAAPLSVAVPASASVSVSLPALPASPKGSVSSVRTGADDLIGFKKVTLDKKAYWINLESGHAYFRAADDSRGDWAGLFSKTPKPHVTKTSAPPADDFCALLDAMA
jgi:hypothetical protein